MVGLAPGLGMNPTCAEKSVIVLRVTIDKGNGEWRPFPLSFVTLKTITLFSAFKLIRE